jgi:transposase
MSKQTSSFRISDELWAKIEPLLPKRENTHPFGGGRPRRPDRDCMDAIVFVLRTGCQWNALDETEICPSSTAHDRFQSWVESGVFWRLWQEGLLEYEISRGIEWDWLSADGCQTKAPLGGKKNRRQPHGSRQGRGQAQRVERRTRRAAGRGGRRRESA